jgi:hypothetical protein
MSDLLQEAGIGGFIGPSGGERHFVWSITLTPKMLRASHSLHGDLHHTAWGRK